MNAQPASLHCLTVHQLSSALQSHRISAVELIDHLFDRIARLDQKLHSFVAFYRDDAHQAAESADNAIRAGHTVGPLHGIPIALKDLIEIEGRVTTGGSEIWRDRWSSTTATLARKGVAAGMIVIGKTHLVEFAMGGWGTNQYMGTPWNPWDAETPRTPGGSSSGSGGGGGGPPGSLCLRHRYRRLSAAAGLVVRHCRPEDDGRPDQQPWNFAACPDARYARADDALGRRRGPALHSVPGLGSTRPAHAIPAARRSDAIAQAWRRWLASCRPSRSGTGRYRSGGTGGLRPLDRAAARPRRPDLRNRAALQIRRFRRAYRSGNRCRGICHPRRLR